MRPPVYKNHAPPLALTYYSNWAWLRYLPLSIIKNLENIFCAKVNEGEVAIVSLKGLFRKIGKWRSGLSASLVWNQFANYLWHERCFEYPFWHTLLFAISSAIYYHVLIHSIRKLNLKWNQRSNEQNIKKLARNTSYSSIKSIVLHPIQ